MPSGTVNQIITPSDEKFFLAPQFPLQRQYEAIRAFLVEEEPSGDVARRFGYSPASFRVLCHRFRHDPQVRASFFRLPQRLNGNGTLETAVMELVRGLPEDFWPQPCQRLQSRS